MKKLCTALLICLGIFWGMGFQSYADEKEIVIVIDPGHGGDNYGANYEGFLEKNITLKVANAMYEHLSKFDGVEVHMTRYKDKGISLKKRATIASNLEADMVVSLHFNASDSHMKYGTECWVPYDNYYEESYILASYIVDELTGLGLYDRGIKTKLNDDGDNYYGIIRESEKLNMPCVLIEHCHMDHEKDIPFYNSDEKLEKLGISDADAIAKYFKLKSEKLGIDYSDLVSDINIPLSENTRNQRGPSECVITVKQYNRQTGETTVILTAKEEASRLLYYDYSMDGGETYSELYPLTGESVEFTFFVEENTKPLLIARAYSLYESYTESNLIDFEADSFFEVWFSEEQDEYKTATGDEALSSMSTAVDLHNDLAKNQKIKFFFFIASMLLFICFFVIAGFGMISIFSKNKSKKKVTDDIEK